MELAFHSLLVSANVFSFVFFLFVFLYGLFNSKNHLDSLSLFMVSSNFILLAEILNSIC